MFEDIKLMQYWSYSEMLTGEMIREWQVLTSQIVKYGDLHLDFIALERMLVINNICVTLQYQSKSPLPPSIFNILFVISICDHLPFLLLRKCVL